MKRLLKILLVAALGFFAWKSISSTKTIQTSGLEYQLTYREQVFPENAKDPLPMVIVLHGAGSDEDDLLSVFKDFKTPVRVISFRGPVKSGMGYHWVSGSGEAQDNMLDDVSHSIASSVAELTSDYPTQGRPFVFGFSWGATVAYHLGLNYPERFAAVFAVAGELPSRFIPESISEQLCPIYGYHGKSDQVIPFGKGKRTTEELAAISSNVNFVEFAEGHTIPEHVIRDIEQQIAATD